MATPPPPQPPPQPPQPPAANGTTPQQNGIATSSVTDMNGAPPGAPIPNIPGNYPLKDIEKPHAHDVLCGRGGGTNNHIGNNHWRTLVNANKRLYISLPKRQKMLVAQSIVRAVRSQVPPGRFLQKDTSSNTWCDIGDQKAQDKTSQALREGAPDLRNSMKEEAKLAEVQGFNPGIAGPMAAPIGGPMAPMTPSMPYMPSSYNPQMGAPMLGMPQPPVVVPMTGMPQPTGAVHGTPGMTPPMPPMTASPVMGGSPMMYNPQQQQRHFEAAVMYNHAAMQAAMMYQPGSYPMVQPPPQSHGQNAFYPNGAPPIPPQTPTARSPSPATKSDSESTDAKDAQPATASASPAPSASDNPSEKEPLGQTETATTSGSDSSKSKSECGAPPPDAPNSVATAAELMPPPPPHFPPKVPASSTAPASYNEDLAKSLPPPKPGAPAPQSAPPINAHSHNDKMTIPIQKEPPQHPGLKSNGDKMQEEEQQQQKQSQKQQQQKQQSSQGTSSLASPETKRKKRASCGTQSKDSPTPATGNGSSGSHIHFFDDQPEVDETSEFQRMIHQPNVDDYFAPAPFSMLRHSNPRMTNESSLIDSDDEDDAPPPVNNLNSLKVMLEMHNQPPPDQANGPVVPPTSLNRNASATMSDIISVDDISLQSMSISRNVSRTLAGMAHDAGGAYIDTNPTNFERAASLAFSEMSLSRGVSLSGPGDVGAIPNPYSGGGEVTFAPGIAGGEGGIFQQQQQAQHEQLSSQHTMALPTQPQGTIDSISQTSTGIDSNGLKSSSNASVSTIQRQNQQGGENAGGTPNDREALEMMYLARGASLAFENFGNDPSS